ncbi:cyclin-dependent kinase inhibitor 1C-like [Anopheles maculipalpis]|uniref:cyclin-dependent kinase inhibitor 1C-like n=1 Tax=Anopheles maculipalpis TaxID=1496333 RepID=UPI00215961C9|nr:cyclin-dependent kinase inhibitor 1C-like [Anopheles maculipalpis]
MFAKLSIVAVCSLLAVAFAEPHVLAPVGPAVVTAQSSQVFARTYNGFVPFAVPAPVPAPIPAPAYHFHTPALVLSAPVPSPVFYPQPVVYNPPTAVPVPVPVPAAPAAVVPTVVAAAPAAKLVAAAPVAKVAKLVRPFHATFRYRSVVA